MFDFEFFKAESYYKRIDFTTASFSQLFGAKGGEGRYQEQLEHLVLAYGEVFKFLDKNIGL